MTCLPSTKPTNSLDHASRSLATRLALGNGVRLLMARPHAYVPTSVQSVVSDARMATSRLATLWPYVAYPTASLRRHARLSIHYRSPTPAPYALTNIRVFLNTTHD